GANNNANGEVHYQIQGNAIIANRNGQQQQVANIDPVDGFVVVSPEEIRTANALAKEREAEKARKEAVKKIKEARAKRVAGVQKVGDAAFGAAATIIGAIDKDSAEIVTFAQHLFDIGTGIGMGVNGDPAGFATAITSSVKILQFAGVIPVKKEVTLADLQDKVMEVNGLVRSLSTKVDKLNNKLALSDWRANDAKLRKLEDDCASMAAFVDLATTVAAEMGYPAPTVNPTEADADAYGNILTSILRSYEKQGVTEFQGVSATMNSIKNDFEDVVVAFSYEGDQSPLCSFDEWWNSRYNWDSQAYSVKNAYKMGIQYDLAKAHSYLQSWYGVGKTPAALAGSFKRYEQAQEAIKNHDCGKSPTEVNNLVKEFREINLHSSTLGITAKKASLLFSLYRNDESMADQTAQAYVNLLDGRSVKEDLELAGLQLMTTKDLSPYANDESNKKEPKGIGIRCSWACTTGGFSKMWTTVKKWGGATPIYSYDSWVRYIAWDGSLATEKSWAGEARADGRTQFETEKTGIFTFAWIR
ncbi:MAG: hypothetical protein Q4B54_08635, partial [Coriobacteriales bacterium]|nr:hypothetical protein [Coriobacteriales bacterium]